MKKLRGIGLILFLSLILGSMTSCYVGMRTDNGRHRSWFHKHEPREHRKHAVVIIGSEKRVRHSNGRH
jgi:hypothetical protein